MKILVIAVCCIIQTAPAQYGGWGIYGPYGRPPPGAYDPPRPPPLPPQRWGPQMEPCIMRGECRGPQPPDLPTRRRYWDE